MDLSHIVMIEDVKIQWRSTELGPFVLLFNQNRISQKEAMRALRTGESSPYVLLLPKSKMDGLFYDIEQPASSNSNNSAAKEELK